MFNKDEFSNILHNIVIQYDSISNFTEIASLDRTYISKYINKKLEHPPSPDILRKISNNSYNVTNYLYLMYICDYLNDKEYGYMDNTRPNKLDNPKPNENSNFEFFYIQYAKLNKFGQKKVNDYIQDLINTNKYN